MIRNFILLFIVSCDLWILPTLSQQQERKTKRPQQHQQSQQQQQYQEGIIQKQRKRKKKDIWEDLHHLSDQQLVQLCLERGFDVLVDELDVETGLPLVSSHQDFVDAAWQCLQMEEFAAKDLREYQRMLLQQQEDKKNHKQERSTSLSSSLSAGQDNTHRKDCSTIMTVDQHNSGTTKTNAMKRPLQQFLANLMDRLIQDGIYLFKFIRRQLDAVANIVRDGFLLSTSTMKSTNTASTTTTTEAFSKRKNETNAEIKQ